MLTSSFIDNKEQNFVCPITQEVMKDPVIAADGHTYERAAIEGWFKNKDTSPVTNLKLPNKNLIPNYKIKSCIEDFLKERGKESEFKERLQKIEQELLEFKTKCFNSYSELKEPLQILLNAKLEKANEEWNKRNDDQRYELLNSIGLVDSSYDFLRMEFKQALSEGTQIQRHAIVNNEGQHPSTEDFWKMEKELHSSWLKKI